MAYIKLIISGILSAILSMIIVPAAISILIWIPILNIFIGGEITKELIINSVVFLNGLNFLINYLGLRNN